MVTEFAYAKINLYLDILDKRADGFHDILSLMHTVSLADIVKVSKKEAKEAKINLSMNTAVLPTDNGNIAYRAAEMYLEKSGVCSEINIEIEKNIPIGAGLAGGSADAAATLRALNKIYGLLSDAEMLLIASELGSDVPFCLVGGSAICEGRGEIMTKVSVAPKNYVIAIGDERVNTKFAYGELDKLYFNFEEPKLPDDVKNKLLSLSEIDGAVYNIFEDIAPCCVKKLKARLSELSATTVLMSGSGPSVFGIFESEQAAKNAEKKLKQEGYSAYFAKSV